MRPFFCLISLSFLVSCSKKGDTGGAATGDAACSSSFVLTQADGTEIPFDDCELQGLDVQFAVAPDKVMPQVHRLSYIFRTASDVSVDCWILWELEKVCGDRDTHNFGTEGSTLGWNTLGCDMAGVQKGAFEATEGGSVFTTREVVPQEGLSDGDPMDVQIQADISAADPDGNQIVGSVAIDETLALVKIPYEGCEGASGDQDGDGFDAVEFGGDDCDDNDPQIGPHAEEVCDEIDNNCDGQIDEGKILTFYQDLDGDGYGDSESIIEACEAPENTSDLAGDCDDNDADIHPDAEEVCDGIDNDCDGTPDDGSAQVAIYLDIDGDGYGQDPAVDVACPDDIPEGHTVDGGDCNEEDTSINPGVSEICGDGIDNNCNFETDEDCP